MTRIVFCVICAVAAVAFATQYPPGTGAITVGGETHYIGLQERPAPGAWDIRWGAGVYDGTATAIVRLRIESDGTQTVEFVSLDKTKPVYIGGVTPTDPQDPEDPKLAALWTELKKVPRPEQGRAAVAKLYRDTAPLPVQTADQLVTVTNSLFAALVDNTNDPAAWRQWKDGADSSIESSGVSSHAEYVAAWGVIADVLEGR